MNSFLLLYKKCMKSGSNIVFVLLRFLFYFVFYRKRLFVHQRVSLKGVRNFEGKGIIEVGISYVGFMHRNDRTVININGKLILKGRYNIGRGCRIDIGRNGLVEIGDGGYVNCNTNIVIMHRLSIGDGCAISWGCQFLDDDFHEVLYEGRNDRDPSIHVGDRVWIGCNVKVYKGSVIPNGCIVASDSIVKGRFDKENCLIGGNPARVLREDVSWR